jgi:hypothetical protein
MRLTPDEIARVLGDHGFRVVDATRYAMYYRHHPGRSVRLLSRQPALAAATSALSAANRVVGRFGNKLAVQAVRTDLSARSARE